MESATQSTPPPPAPKVFVIRVTDPENEHALLGYAFVQQTAFFPAQDHEEASPEVRIVLQGLQKLFEKSGEFALAAIPFDAAHDPGSGSLMLGANVSGANVRPNA